jgi:hypothetical protein
MNLEELLKHFVTRNLIPREQQTEVLEQVAADWDSKKYFVISAHVG